MTSCVINPSLSIGKSRLYFYLPLIYLLFPSFPAILPELVGFQVIFALECMTVIALYGDLYRPVVERNTRVVVGYFIFATILSLICDTGRGVVVAADFFELTKPVAFLLFFWLYRYSLVDIELIEKQTIRALWVVFLLLSLWSVLSFIFPSQFYPLEILLYKRESMAVHRGKAIGSFSQTYHFAFCLLLPLALSLIAFVREFRVKYLVGFLLVLLAMLLTQSRSMYICTAVCVVVCMFLPVHYKNLRSGSRSLLLLLSLGAGIGCVVLYYFDDIAVQLKYAVEGFMSMADGQNNSVNIRQSQVEWAIENNPFVVLGAGIGKGEMMLESFYSLYYYRYGLCGVVLSLLLTLRTAWAAYVVASKEYYNHRKLSYFYFSLSVFYALTPLATLSSCHMDSPKISLIFYGLMGLVYAKYAQMKSQAIKCETWH